MIIPFPNGAFRYEGKHFTLSSEYEIECPPSFSCNAFIERMAKLGYRLSNDSSFVIRYKQEYGMKNESYILYITDNGVDIFANDEAGFRYGLTSFYMTIVSKKGKVRPMIVEDSPRYEYRGFMLDCCRHSFKIEEIKKIIEQCSLLKINYFHWHLSDDQGYRIESKAFPLLNIIGSYRKLSSIDPLVKSGEMRQGDTYGGYYTQDEIREVVAYANERSVTIVPEIEMPGHVSSLLASYPELSCSGKRNIVRNQFGIFKTTLCVGKETTNAFINTLLDEVISLFPGKYIHLGGDECPSYEWENCPQCSTIGDKSFIQAEFMNRVISYLKRKGKTAIAWNESFKGQEIDESAIGQYWNEMGPGKSVAHIETKKGRKFIMSNMNAFYFDYPSADLPLRATLGYYPNMKGERVNPIYVYGVEACLWTEWIKDEKTLEEQLFPRLLAFSQGAWNVGKVNATFYKDMKRFLSMKELNILHGITIEDAEPKRENSLKTIVLNMQELSSRYHIPKEEMDPDNVTFQASGEGNTDKKTSLTSFFEEKLRFGYTKQDIKKIVAIIEGGSR